MLFPIISNNIPTINIILAANNEGDIFFIIAKNDIRIK